MPSKDVVDESDYEHDEHECQCLPKKAVVETEVPYTHHTTEYLNVEGENLKCCERLLEALRPHHAVLLVDRRRNRDECYQNLQVREDASAAQEAFVLQHSMDQP